jgi:hypothetical protein
MQATGREFGGDHLGDLRLGDLDQAQVPREIGLSVVSPKASSELVCLASVDGGQEVNWAALR